MARLIKRKLGTLLKQEARIAAMEWKITLSDLCYDEAERRAVAEVLASGWLTMGPRVERFEEALSERLGGAQVIAVSSCTAALHLALLGLGIGPGDEVIVPSLTFAATANVVAICGARPVFADIISLAEPTLDPEHAAALMTPRTRAIIPMHYAGFPCRMSQLLELARGAGRNIAIIEDAAHGFGGSYQLSPSVCGATAPEVRARPCPSVPVCVSPDACAAPDKTEEPLGTLGEAGAFSFFSNKNLATGEGGAVATRDPELAARLRRLRSHGMTATTWTRHKGGAGGYEILEPGLNYRPTEITAALGLAQLEKFIALQAARRRLYDLYVLSLADIRSVAMPFLDKPVPGVPAYHIFPILLPDAAARDRAADALRAAGIQTSHHYHPLHLMPAYQGQCGSLPICEEFAARELTLPFHPRMTGNHIAAIAAILRQEAP